MDLILTEHRAHLRRTELPWWWGYCGKVTLCGLIRPTEDLHLLVGPRPLCGSCKRIAA